GKTTLVLESLIPALEAAAKGEALPAHVESITAPGIAHAFSGCSAATANARVPFPIIRYFPSSVWW
ncbi:hypothetical protein OSM86_25180, partial [Escherichia coli]|nr:hypothetical protein [Escherichia coli]